MAHSNAAHNYHKVNLMVSHVCGVPVGSAQTFLSVIQVYSECLGSLLSQGIAIPFFDLCYGKGYLWAFTGSQYISAG